MNGEKIRFNQISDTEQLNLLKLTISLNNALAIFYRKRSDRYKTPTSKLKKIKKRRREINCWHAVRLVSQQDIGHSGVALALWRS